MTCHEYSPPYRLPLGLSASPHGPAAPTAVPRPARPVPPPAKVMTLPVAGENIRYRLLDESVK